MENLIVNISTLPFFLIFALLLKKYGILKKNMAESLSFVGFNIGLSSLIFLSFLKSPISTNDLLNPFLGFAFAFVLFLIGLILVNLLKISKNSRAIFVGSLVTLEGGSIGYPFFSAIFGVENLPKIALLDLGMATFAFTILTYYFYKETGIICVNRKKQFMEIIKIPILPAMFLGLLFNLTGINFSSLVVVGGAIFKFLEALSVIAVPLILMSLVLNMEINYKTIKKTLLFSFGSIAVTVLLALVFSLLWNILPLNNLTKGALLIMAFLPPSFYPFVLAERLNLSADKKETAAQLFSATVFVSITLLLLFSSIIAKIV